jgi:carboxyl-terminal processing protease
VSTRIAGWPPLARAGAVLLSIALSACAEPALPPPAAQNAPEPLFARALHDIGDLYLDPVPMRQLTLSGAAMLSHLDAAIAVDDGGGDGLTLRYAGRVVARDTEPIDNSGERWGAVVGRLVDAARTASPTLAAMPPPRVEKAVFQGLLAPLDPYSRYLDPDVASDQRARLDGFGGIGVTLDGADHRLRVAAVTPAGPAERAGIRAEDAIVAINGIATAGVSEEEAVQQLRGPVGSAVALQVLHPGGAAAQELRLRRAPVGEAAVAMARDGNLAVLRVAGFNRSTTRRVAEAIAAAKQETGGQLAGIVLDLRGNPGGLLDQAVSLADLFIPHGPIAATIGRNPASRQYFAASGAAVVPLVPLAVLINGRSASASEVVAAALQDSGRGIVIGSASYGKGTVQTVLRLPNNGELILTWARLVAPAGYLLQGHGVVPTLCTASVTDDAAGLAAELQLAAAAPGSARPRAALDEAGWSALRQACPPQYTQPAVDLQLAERLLADPALYGEALRAFAAPSHVAQSDPRRSLP